LKSRPVRNRTKPEIVDLTWYRRGDEIRITDAEGHTAQMVGSETVATVLAKDAGLSPVEAFDNTRRWARKD
jgi:hypothetical protein